MKTKPELNFPMIRGRPLPPSVRSMDEINDWIEQDYPYFFNREAYDKAKKRLSVNIPFVLK